MQAEAVTVRPGGEPVGEDARKILRGNAHAVVPDDEADGVAGARLQAKREHLVAGATLVQRILGVADQVDEDLQHLAPFRQHGRDRFELAHDAHLMARQGGDVQAQGISPSASPASIDSTIPAIVA